LAIVVKSHSFEEEVEGLSMPTQKAQKPAKVLVIDVGGTNVKMLASGQKEPRKSPSGPEMTAQKMVQIVKQSTKDWDYDRISLGYPGPIINGRPLR
jgi:polyphosphate glucokinase